MNAWEQYQRLVRDVAFEQYREERAREWASLLKLMRLNLERDIARFSDYRELPAPITQEDVRTAGDAIRKMTRLPKEIGEMR